MPYVTPAHLADASVISGVVGTITEAKATDIGAAQGENKRGFKTWVRKRLLSLIVFAFVFSTWIFFAVATPDELVQNPGNGVLPLVIGSIGSALFLLVTGVLVVQRKDIGGSLMVVLLFALASSIVLLYASYYLYLSTHHGFQKPLNKVGAFELAASNLTNSGLDSPKPRTEVARIAELTQGMTDWVFIVVIISVWVAKLSASKPGDDSPAEQANSD
jgi:multisubunit Na+/H+ antiporter MnhB subunit